MVASVVDWAAARGIGFSHLVSLGDMSDVDFGDMLDRLADDPECAAVLLYVEAITHARKFMSAARRAARSKPVIVVKAGRFAEGARAVASHTGALAGSDAVYDAAFRRAGMLRVFDLEELFAAVETLGNVLPPAGERLTILTNGGGMGVLATDALIEAGGQLSELSEETKAQLDSVLPPTWSRGNPVDIIGDATPDRYASALDVLLQDPATDAILVLNCPTGIASSRDAAELVAKHARARGRMVLTSWVGGAAASAAREPFTRAGLPTYDTPEQAVRAFMHTVQYRRNQQVLMETPASIPEEFEPDRDAARGIVQRALGDGRDLLTAPESESLIAAYRVPVVGTKIAASPDEAAALATQLGGPVALKILSRDITHKSDVGGVALDLPDPQAVAAAARTMLDRIRGLRPNARIEGFTVARMIRRPGAHELIIGMMDDLHFGPVILFGQGGTGVEIVKDQALALPPLNMALARELMSRTRVYRLLQGYRDRPKAALDAIAVSLVKVAQLAADLAEVTELDINPLLADHEGVLALDARVRVKRSDVRGSERFAIRPYPRELEDLVALPDGRCFLLRPVRPEDEPQFREGFQKLSAEHVRMRFFAPMRELTHQSAARLTQIDYEREMALVLTDNGVAGQMPIYGGVRMIAEPDGGRAEFAVTVRDDMAGQGLGTLLMRRILQYAASRGIGEIYGTVLAENKAMLALCRDLGFHLSYETEEPGIVRVSRAP
jgi:acetyltransferase